MQMVPGGVWQPSTARVGSTNACSISLVSDPCPLWASFILLFSLTWSGILGQPYHITHIDLKLTILLHVPPHWGHRPDRKGALTSVSPFKWNALSGLLPLGRLEGGMLTL